LSESVCEVVWQKNWDHKKHRWVAAFSWTLDGKSDRMTDLKAIEKAVNVGLDVSRGKIPDLISLLFTPGMLNYYNRELVTPSWARYVTYGVQIEDHYFVELAKR
jgi:hypothetical protein